MDEAEQTKPKPKGRPKKVNVEREPLRPPLREPLHSVFDDPAVLAAKYDEVAEANEPRSVLHIDEDLMRSIREENGQYVAWHAHECFGKTLHDQIIKRQRLGWEPVKRGFAGGKLDFLFGRLAHYGKGGDCIEAEGLVLDYRPWEIELKARAYEKRKAQNAVDQMRQSHSTAGIGVPGGNSPQALAHNRHRQSFEPYRPDDIPE
jgi:hypothetical protein